MNKKLSKEERAELLLASVEAHGGTFRIEQTPVSVELRVGNLSKLPEDVFSAVMNADIDATGSLLSLISGRKQTRHATV